MRILVASALLLPSACLAIDVDWDGGGNSSEWNDPFNWEFNMVPNSNDTATILNDTATITGTIAPPVGDLRLGLGTTPGGLTMSSGVNFAMLEVAGTLQLSTAGSLDLGAGNVNLLATKVTNRGEVSVGNGAQLTAFSDYAQNVSSSKAVLMGGRINAPTLRVFDGVVIGEGVLDGNVIIGNGSALSSPSLQPGIGIGTLEIDGDLNLDSNAEFAATIDTTGKVIVADKLQVNGTATLGGTLKLRIIGGGDIPFNNAVKVLVADGIDPGTTFDDITISTDGDQAIVVTQIPTSGGGGGSLSAGIRFHTSQSPGDMFNDQVVDAKDAALFAWAIRDTNTYREQYFLSGYTGPCPVTGDNPEGICGVAEEKLADIDGDNALTFADIPAFLEIVAFSGGNVAAAAEAIVAVLSSNQVPEPATLWLGIFALGSMGLCRWR